MVTVDTSAWRCPDSRDDTLEPGTYDLRLSVEDSKIPFTTARITFKATVTITQAETMLRQNYSGKRVLIIGVLSLKLMDKFTRDDYALLVGLAQQGLEAINGTAWAKYSAQLDEILQRHPL